MEKTEEEIILGFVDSLYTVDDLIMEIADEYTENHSDESYKRNKEMLRKFAVKMGLISE